MSSKREIISVQDAEIQWFSKEDNDYLCLTDIARKFNPNPMVVIMTWARKKDTIEFLGIWESMHNPAFNFAEFAEVRDTAGTNRFVLSFQHWITDTNAIGIRIKTGRNEQIYAHKDIALGFCYWLSPAFQIYLIKEFQRLKEIENEQKEHQLQWSLRRELAKVNYRVHTEAVQLLMPPKLDELGERYLYSNEADLLNVALFGMTAQEWRVENPDKKGNMRDHATIEQLTVLSNLENLNAEYIKAGLEQDERLSLLNQRATEQMTVLLNYNAAKNIKALE